MGGESTVRLKAMVEENRFLNLVLHWTFFKEEMATEIMELHH